jgi:hypothetical protein
VELTSNAGEIADRLDAAADELADLTAANEEAGRLGLEAIDAQTPRRTGTLAAGARSVADPYGFAYVNATPYAVHVDARTGFATDTLRLREETIASVYEEHIEAALTLT